MDNCTGRALPAPMKVIVSITSTITSQVQGSSNRSGSMQVLFQTTFDFNHCCAMIK